MIPKEQINRRGRKKGSLNKNTEIVRSAFQLLVNSNLEQLQNDLENLSPKDRINAIIQMAKFVLPQLQSIDLNSQNNFDSFKPIEITFTNEN